MIKNSVIVLSALINCSAFSMITKESRVSFAANTKPEFEKTVVKLLPYVCTVRKNNHSDCNIRFPSMPKLIDHVRQKHMPTKKKRRKKQFDCAL